MGLDKTSHLGTGADRRTALRLAIGAAMLPVLASGRVMAQQPGEGTGFTPPSGLMVYRRILARQLPGGAQLRVARDFSVQFASSGGGFEVSGHQIAVQVEAPAAIGRFAELEEQRIETGIFPLLLDQSGRIVDGQEARPSEEFVLALDDARRRHDGSSDEAELLVQALHATGSRLTSQLPADLFAPEQTAREAREEILLPWGDSGEVVTLFQAARDPGTGLMRAARRDVVTRLGSDERRSGEEWQLFRI
jgi:hypothetical protein